MKTREIGYCTTEHCQDLGKVIIIINSTFSICPTCNNPLKTEKIPLSSPEKKEVCKEAFESGYGGKLSKKAEKEFENIYSKLEKKEEVKCECCKWDDMGYQHEPQCPLYKEVEKEEVEVCGVRIGKDMFKRAIQNIRDVMETDNLREKEEPTQEFNKKELIYLEKASVCERFGKDEVIDTEVNTLTVLQWENLQNKIKSLIERLLK